MKRIKKISILTLIALLTASCFPSKKVTGPSVAIAPLSDTTRMREGTLVYALPMTVFTIKVEFERIIELPGPYSKYAGDLLGLKNVISGESEQWSVKGIAVSSHEEVDPSEFFVINCINTFISNVLALKKQGLILDINPESNYPNDGTINSKEINTNQFRSNDLGSDEYFISRTDTVYRRVSVNSQYIRIPYTVEKKKQLTEDQLAERAARRLMDIRDGKVLILTGEATVFPQSAAPIDEINRMEKEYLELFTGKTFAETRIFTYSLIPQKEQAAKSVVLFRFSESTGPEDAGSKTGTPVSAELVPAQKTKDISLITRVPSASAATTNDKLFFRMPDVVDFKIKMGNITLYDSRKLIYQFGETMQLPSNYLLGK
jgi:hypothetical protein